VICKTGNPTWTKCVFKLCFRYFPNLVCNNSWLRGVVSLLPNYLWNVTYDVFMLNDVILVVRELVWNPLLFRFTTGIIWAQVWKFEHFGACFCTCALIIWMVLLHRWFPVLLLLSVQGAPSTQEVVADNSGTSPLLVTHSLLKIAKD
jgi:hypothetical protein